MIDEADFSTAGRFANKPRRHRHLPTVAMAFLLLVAVAAVIAHSYSLSPPRSFPTTAVRSTAISSVAYDAASSTLTIGFVSGTEYNYFGVPSAVAHGLLAAESKGQYFNSEIKPTYRFQQILRVIPPLPSAVTLPGLWSTSTNDKFMISDNNNVLNMRFTSGPTFTTGSADLTFHDGKWHGLFHAVFKSDTLGVRRMGPIVLTEMDSTNILVDAFTIEWDHLGAETKRTPIQFSLVRIKN